jgi:hypothetical protein
MIPNRARASRPFCAPPRPVRGAPRWPLPTPELPVCFRGGAVGEGGVPLKGDIPPSHPTLLGSEGWRGIEEKKAIKVRVVEDLLEALSSKHAFRASIPTGTLKGLMLSCSVRRLEKSRSNLQKLLFLRNLLFLGNLVVFRPGAAGLVRCQSADKGVSENKCLPTVSETGSEDRQSPAPRGREPMSECGDVRELPMEGFPASTLATNRSGPAVPRRLWRASL